VAVRAFSAQMFSASPVRDVWIGQRKRASSGRLTA